MPVKRKSTLASTVKKARKVVADAIAPPPEEGQRRASPKRAVSYRKATAAPSEPASRSSARPKTATIKTSTAKTARGRTASTAAPKRAAKPTAKRTPRAR